MENVEIKFLAKAKEIQEKHQDYFDAQEYAVEIPDIIPIQRYYMLSTDWQSKHIAYQPVGNLPEHIAQELLDAFNRLKEE